MTDSLLDTLTAETDALVDALREMPAPTPEEFSRLLPLVQDIAATLEYAIHDTRAARDAVFAIKLDRALS